MFGKSAAAIYLLIQNKSQGFLLMVIEPIKPENFANFPWTQRPPFCNPHLRELRARFLRVSSSDMQSKMWLVYKNWRHGNRFVARVRRPYFSAETSDSRKYVCVRRLSAHWCSSQRQKTLIASRFVRYRSFEWNLTWNALVRESGTVFFYAILNLSPWYNYMIHRAYQTWHYLFEP